MFRQIEKLQKLVNNMLGLCSESGANAQLRLEKWLMCDKKALRYYVEFQSLTALLYTHFNPDRFSETLIGEQVFASQ